LISHVNLYEACRHPTGKNISSFLIAPWFALTV
jgi:hypothetical protein